MKIFSSFIYPIYPHSFSHSFTVNQMCFHDKLTFYMCVSLKVWKNVVPLVVVVVWMNDVTHKKLRMNPRAKEITIIPQALCMNKFNIKIPWKWMKSNSLNVKERTHTHTMWDFIPSDWYVKIYLLLWFFRERKWGDGIFWIDDKF